MIVEKLYLARYQLGHHLRRNSRVIAELIELPCGAPSVITAGRQCMSPDIKQRTGKVKACMLVITAVITLCLIRKARALSAAQLIFSIVNTNACPGRTFLISFHLVFRQDACSWIPNFQLRYIHSSGYLLV